MRYVEFRKKCPFKKRSFWKPRVCRCANDQLNPDKCPERAERNCRIWQIVVNQHCQDGEH